MDRITDMMKHSATVGTWSSPDKTLLAVAFPPFSPTATEWMPVAPVKKTMGNDDARTLAFAMTTKPRSYHPVFDVFQILYATRPESMRMCGSLHQNSMEDVLHLTVALTGAHGTELRLHINGYMTVCFKVQTVTMVMKLEDGPIVIADFR
jgi:hypothetical protein